MLTKGYSLLSKKSQLGIGVGAANYSINNGFVYQRFTCEILLLIYLCSPKCSPIYQAVTHWELHRECNTDISQTKQIKIFDIASGEATIGKHKIVFSTLNWTLRLPNEMSRSGLAPHFIRFAISIILASLGLFYKFSQVRQRTLPDRH